jgi:hypothetical protein
VWPSRDLMPVPPRWPLSSPAGRTVPPDSRMATRHPGQESTGQERRPRHQPRKARFSSGLVQSRLLSCSRHKSDASGQTGQVSRQVDNLPRHVTDLAGGGRKGPHDSSTGSRPTLICGKSVANRLRVEPPVGFEPRTYALRDKSPPSRLRGKSARSNGSRPIQTPQDHSSALASVLAVGLPFHGSDPRFGPWT